MHYPESSEIVEIAEDIWCAGIHNIKYLTKDNTVDAYNCTFVRQLNSLKNTPSFAAVSTKKLSFTTKMVAKLQKNLDNWNIFRKETASCLVNFVVRKLIY